MRQTKSGYYTLYKGKEFRLAKVKNGDIFLISENDEDLLKGFVVLNNPYDNRKLLEKKITPSEVGAVYAYSTYWLYKGCRVMVKNDADWFNDDLTKVEIIIDSPNLELARREGFQMFMDRDYIGTVPKSALELVETKTPAPNYFKI